MGESYWKGFDKMIGKMIVHKLISAQDTGIFTITDDPQLVVDAANKIGTSMAALAAARYHIPFYVCAPTSTIDMSLEDGAGIVIEQRPAEEVTEMWYRERMTARNVKVYNPAFDVTDHDLITGIITEYGIAYPPFKESLKEVFRKKGEKA